MLSRLVKENILALKPYEIKDIPCRVKLDANESPYGYVFEERLLEGFKPNRYPDPQAMGLKRVLAKQLNVKAENIVYGNGSDELIYYITMVFGGPVMVLQPTFAMYEIVAKVLGEETISVALDGGFDIDVDRVVETINKEKPRIIYISSPNNPSGNAFERERIIQVINAATGVVIVDEAYIAFSSVEGFINAHYENVIVMRTMSKIGFAALRMGFAIGYERLIAEINKVRLPYNVNTLSQELAMRALDNPYFINHTVEKIVEERRRLYETMRGLHGIKVYPSEANFILFETKSAKDIYASLLRQGILVKKLGGALEGYFRVTVGTPDENEFFLRTLREITGNV
ncbi:MAG: histidinol-phosphate transaminase [Candidatus Magnetoovum sp. WYHC-5]|nr:histidinol-phosphate transaminase [Candidatus Magnetoovum sp. WYHC-5]